MDVTTKYECESFAQNATDNHTYTADTSGVPCTVVTCPAFTTTPRQQTVRGTLPFTSASTSVCPCDWGTPETRAACVHCTRSISVGACSWSSGHPNNIYTCRETTCTKTTTYHYTPSPPCIDSTITAAEPSECGHIIPTCNCTWSPPNRWYRCAKVGVDSSNNDICERAGYEIATNCPGDQCRTGTPNCPADPCPTTRLKTESCSCPVATKICASGDARFDQYNLVDATTLGCPDPNRQTFHSRHVANSTDGTKELYKCECKCDACPAGTKLNPYTSAPCGCYDPVAALDCCQLSWLAFDNVTRVISNSIRDGEAHCVGYRIPSGMTGNCNEGAAHQQLWEDYFNAGSDGTTMSLPCRDEIEGSAGRGPSTDVAKHVRQSSTTPYLFEALGGCKSYEGGYASGAYCNTRRGVTCGGNCAAVCAISP